MDAKNLRNVALLSHSGAGKTSLSEAVLFNTKAVTRLGKIEDGNTVSDYEPEEVKRGGSIQTTLIAVMGDGFKINLLDTPGYDDFIGEVVSALRVVEGAAILVAAPSGVDVGTERSWAMCEAAKVPRLIVVNKMDRENADFDRNVADIQATFGRQCVPFQIPIGAAQDFTGVVSVIDPNADVPAELADAVAAARERLIEAAAESDDELADRYLSGEDLTAAEIENGLRTAVLQGELVPILATSATANVGVDGFLSMMRSFLPSPVEAEKPPTGESGYHRRSRLGGRLRRPVGCLGVQDHGRPLRRQAFDVQGLPRDYQEQLRGLGQQPRASGASRSTLPAQGQKPGQSHRSHGRRHRGGR